MANEEHNHEHEALLKLAQQHATEEHDDEPHDEGHDGNDELWLISYSDLMTLLFGFFVLMYSMSKSTTTKQEKVKESMQKTFSGSYSATDDKLAKDIKNLAKKATESEFMGQMEITQPKDGLEITFRSNILFPSGSATLNPSVEKTMSTLIGLISSNVKDAEIMIAGHTDDVPINTEKFPSNWELSAARAAAVVKSFEKNGYAPQLLVGMGYGSSRPAFQNRTQEGKSIPSNQEKNRRVVIKVVSPGVVKQPTPLKKDGSANTENTGNESNEKIIEAIKK